MKKTIFGGLAALTLAIGLGCARDEPIELKMEVNAPLCSNHPRVQIIDRRGIFSEECGNYSLRRFVGGSYQISEYAQQEGIVPLCSNMKVWHDYNGDDFIEEVELRPNSCILKTEGYLFHTPELQQEYEAILRGIGKNEVEANVETWLHCKQ